MFDLQVAKDTAEVLKHVKETNEVLQLIDHVIVIVGVPFAIVKYFRDQKKDRDARDLELKARHEARRREQEARDREQEARVREREARETATYDQLDDKYLEFERFCFEHPDLDIFDVADEKKIQDSSSVKTPASSPSVNKREVIAFTMLFSIFEHAYTMYLGQDSAFRRRQWTGWDEFIGSYCARQNFRDAWERSGQTFDTEFQTYMQGKIAAGVEGGGT